MSIFKALNEKLGKGSVASKILSVYWTDRNLWQDETEQEYKTEAALKKRLEAINKINPSGRASIFFQNKKMGQSATEAFNLSELIDDEKPAKKPAATKSTKV